MARARFVVVEGPDVGQEFPLPLRGGGVGRDDDNLVRLTDLSVSRHHCAVELRDGRLAVIDSGSRNQTLVNGTPISEHVLSEGDVLTVGKTRLAFIPSEEDSSEAPVTPGKLTMEIASREVFALVGEKKQSKAENRAQRHLATIAKLGESLNKVKNRNELETLVCEAAKTALAADRAVVWARGRGGELSPAAASLRAGMDTNIVFPPDLLGKVLGEGKSIGAESLAIGNETRDVVASPLWSADNTPSGLLWIDRRSGITFDRTDVMAAGCLAHLFSAAVAAFDARAALTRENRELEAQLGGREFIGSSPAASAVLNFVSKVAPSDATVLLGGESGSGKEMVARAIHKNSRRAESPFVAINCAALTESLIESELFGHEKGAFTGAAERKAGRFELADKGTLFLDEVGELPLNCQTKFLRVLEEQCFERVGGGKTMFVDVRVVAATNRDLFSMAQAGTFREDLYYRLSVIHTSVPPLRERANDIPELCNYFLARLRHQVPRRVERFSDAAMAAMVGYHWPGNVRELKNAVERAIVLGEGDTIEVSALPPNITGQPSQFRAPSQPGSAPGPASTAPVTARPLKELERDGIIAALEATEGNKAKAAQLLEIDRSTLYKKIKDYGIG